MIEESRKKEYWLYCASINMLFECQYNRSSPLGYDWEKPFLEGIPSYKAIENYWDEYYEKQRIQKEQETSQKEKD